MKYKHKVRVNSSSESKGIISFLSHNGFIKPYGNFILLDGWVCIDEFKNILCVAKSQAGKEIDSYKSISFDQLKDLLKPKEYLFKGIDGTYKVVDHDCQGRAIEIPEGADIAYKKLYSDGIAFTSSDWMNEYYKGSIIKRTIRIGDQYESGVVWRRHTQPEELPFVDDGDDEKSDCDSKLGNFVVDDTLSQRQSQYGEFKEVASTTQYLLQMLSNDKMSDVQLESLHMICSKLSRIAHGDPNHADSWHDIAGYATLVVKDIS